MPNDWKPAKLDELGFVGRGKSRHRPRNEPSLYGGPHPFVQTADIMASEFRITSYSKTYSEAGLAQSKRWEPMTLCMTIAGENTAETALLGIRACFPDSVVGFIADPKKSDVRFVKYALDTMKKSFRSVTKGATQDNLSLEKLLSFDILTPPLPVQKRIADVLSGYDYLIENNMRRIQVLERMAQAIYREWFVNFRFPGHAKVKLVPSPLGPIPIEWRVESFSKIAHFINGYAFKPTDWGEVGRAIIKIKELKEGVTSQTPGALQKKYQVVDGDLLFSWSADLDVYIWSHGDGWLNQHLFQVLPSMHLPRSFLFHALKERMSEFRARSAGTTMRHIKRAALDEVSTVCPPEALVEMFESVAVPLHRAVINLRRQNIVLRRTRNLLLPRLLSGHVEVATDSA